MQVVSLTSRELRKLEELKLDGRVVNTEGKLYIYDHKDKWRHVKELIKLYYNQSPAYLKDKINIILELLVNKEYLEMEELVLPNAIVALDGKMSGFVMPYIENNINLTLLLHNPHLNLYYKLEYLKEIYRILDKVSNIKELEGKFFLGDIHEANFILDTNDSKIKAIDIDSSYINNSSISVSKFLIFNELLYGNMKYPMDEDDRVIPNQNSTILCFIYMLLNVLSGNKDSHKWSLNEFYNYLSFLQKMKVDKNLLDCISSIYEATVKNEFDISLLNSIDVNKDYTLKRARVPKSTQGYYYN